MLSQGLSELGQMKKISQLSDQFTVVGFVSQCGWSSVVIMTTAEGNTLCIEALETKTKLGPVGDFL